MRQPEHAPASVTEPHRPARPHIATLESPEEQVELQSRLSLMIYQLEHPDVRSAFNPSAPETVDMEIRSNAMMLWAKLYGKAFREWVDGGDKRVMLNMDDEHVLMQTLNDVLELAEESRSKRPPTIH